MALRIRQALRQASMKMADKLRIPRWLDHAVRETAQEQRSPLFVIAPYATRLDDVAAKTVCAAPDEIARLGFAIAHAIDAERARRRGTCRRDEWLALRLLFRFGVERPVVVSGLGCRSEAVLEASAQVARALIQRAGLPRSRLRCRNEFGWR